MNYTPGPGDEATWGAYCGHPNDPRAPEWDEEENEEIEEKEE